MLVSAPTLLSPQAMGEFIIAAYAFGLAPVTGYPACIFIHGRAGKYALMALSMRTPPGSISRSPASWPVSRALACLSNGAGLRGGGWCARLGRV